MPRRARVVLDNVLYHVITSGNEKRVVFKDALDYMRYLGMLKKYREKTGFRLYGWCLMPNHVHLLIESNSLSKVMHGISLSYAKYFKYRYKSIGHFWQDRFRSFPIQKDQYLINCISYIEYNPVRAKIVMRPEDYKWSSYSDRVLGKRSGLLDDLIM